MTRRARGSVFQRTSDGRWACSLSVRDPYTNRTKRVTEYPEQNTKPAAEKLLARLITQSESDTLLHGGKVKLKAHAEKWVEEVVSRKSKPNTVSQYKGMLDRHIIPRLGEVALRDITTQSVHDFDLWLLGKGLSSNSVSQVHSVLAMCLHQAMVWDLLTRNVASLVSPPPPKPKQMHVWSVDEAQAFLRATRSDTLHPLYAVALSLGLRKGELLGLRWQDIDLDACTLSVNGQLLARVMGAPRKRGTTKNSRSRTLDIPRSLVKILSAHRAKEIEKCALLHQEWSFDRYVFTNSHGRALDHNIVLLQLRDAAKRAGVRVLTVHELRHSCASLLYAKGIPIVTISKVLGHVSPQITMNLYTHLFQQSYTDAADAMEGLLG